MTTYLVDVSSAQAHRTAGVQLLRRDADLRAEPELAAVDEPARRVDQHDGGVDGGGELRGPRSSDRVTIVSECPVP